MKARILICVCIAFGSICSAQIDDCYEMFMRAGDKALESRDYTEATQYYEAARQCVDISTKEDSVAQAKYAGAYTTWTRRLNSAIAEANRQKDSADRARGALEVELERSERLRKEAEQARAEAEAKRREAEANRMALVSAGYLDQGRNEEAFDVSLEALALHNDKDVYLAFGNATFANYKELLPFLEGGVMELCFGSDGDPIAARSVGTLYLNQNDQEVLSESDPGIIAYDVAEVGSDVLYATNRGVAVINSANGQPVIKWSAGTDEIADLHVGPTGEVVVVTRGHNMYQWIGTPDSVKSKISFTGHTAPIESIAFTTDGSLMSRSLDKTVRMWSADGTLNWTYQFDHFVTGTLLSPDGSRVIATSASGELIILNAGTGELVVGEKPHTAFVSGCVSMGEQGFVTCSFDGTAKHWSWQGDVKRVVDLGGPVVSAQVASVSNSILFRLEVDGLVICNQDLAISKEWYATENESLIDASISPDGSHVITAHSDNSVRLWNAKGEEVMTPPLFSDSVWNCGFTPNGEHLWASSKDGTAWICDMPNLIYDSAKSTW